LAAEREAEGNIAEPVRLPWHAGRSGRSLRESRLRLRRLLLVETECVLETIGGLLLV
jgi:hypothetical protein